MFVYPASLLATYMLGQVICVRVIAKENLLQSRTLVLVN